MEQIINANGSQYGMTVNSDGSINTIVSGINVNVGSLLVDLEDVYVRSGNIFVVSGNAWAGVGSVYGMNLGSETWIKGGSIQTFGIGSFYSIETTPTLISNNPSLKILYIYSGTSTGVTGSSIGSIIKYIGAGSYVKVLSYNGGNLISVGSWV